MPPCLTPLPHTCWSTHHTHLCGVGEVTDLEDEDARVLRVEDVDIEQLDIGADALRYASMDMSEQVWTCVTKYGHV